MHHTGPILTDATTGLNDRSGVTIRDLLRSLHALNMYRPNSCRPEKNTMNDSQSSNVQGWIINSYTTVSVTVSDVRLIGEFTFPLDVERF